MPSSLILENDQAAVNGIRAVGAKQLILAPGNGGSLHLLSYSFEKNPGLIALSPI